MVPKRHFGELGGEEFPFPVPDSKRRPLFNKWVVLVRVKIGAFVLCILDC